MSRTLRELDGHSVTELKSAAGKLGDRLQAMGITTVLDLLEHYPRRYLDRTKRAAIGELRIGEEATVFAEVVSASARSTRNRRQLVEVTVTDGVSRLTATFFNQGWRAKQLTPGTEVSLFGKLDLYKGRRQMTNPVVDVIGETEDKTGVVVPLYPQSAKSDVSSWQLLRLVGEALRRVPSFADPLPAGVRDRYRLVDRTTAYHGIHQPETVDASYVAARRLIFDEFLRMQVGLVARKRAYEQDRMGIVHVVDGALVPAFLARLPFELTNAQSTAVAEIARDMTATGPMHRLLQGDVGSGKTVVAVIALLMAVQGGWQGALMAPTEVLAEQHHLGIAQLLADLVVPSDGSLLGERPVRVELLTNRTGAAERRRIAEGLMSGEVDILIGTHALLYEGVDFARLGMVVIDEQHRFGVEQRALLRGKGDEPDVLVMTATPIPRTAAMLVYGDLDKSELRELPPGRTPIRTEVVSASPLDRLVAYDRVRTEVAAGHQAYVVCPLVEGSDRVEAKAATEELDRLRAEEFGDLRLALLHGQMPSREKEAVMTSFRDHEIDVLVATTVIEVGVDVPNATVMIVEDADRFGLSQLHQLRGRVGRGAVESWCYLFAEPATPDAEARMAAMAESTDGFLLAERDLEIRGAGEVFGERQSGFSDLKLGRVPRDEKIVMEARAVAEELLASDARLQRNRQLAEEVEDLLGDDVEFLFKS